MHAAFFVCFDAQGGIDMYDILIIGAGVVGAMISRELSKYHISICIVDKDSDVGMGATKANSGIVHAGFDARSGSLKALMNVKGSQMMKQITDELGVKYKNNGSLVIGFNKEDIEVLTELYNQGIQNGVQNLEMIDRKRLKELEPNITDNALGALYAPTGAIVCPYELTIGAIGNAMDNDAELKLKFQVDKIEPQNDGYTVFSKDGQVIQTQYIINAAGLWADDIARMVGDFSFNIHPRRGEYMLLDKACGNLVTHTIFRVPSKMGKGILVTPTVDGNLLLGPTSEDIADKENKETTPQGLEKIMNQALENVSGIPIRSVITSFCGLRSTGNTGDFIINTPRSNFINVAGIESPGLSAAPAIGKYVVDMLKEMDLQLIKKTDFNPYRPPSHAFREMSIEEKNKIIRTNSKYGKIICRCEGISEGEIIEAIHTNPKATDLDGVKRRTRSGMGRCQGGFCSPFIIEILARELNIPIEEVTKFGGKSIINIGKTK